MPDVRWGLTLPFAGVPLHQHPDLMRRAEAAGYDDLWTGETAGPDGFTPLAVAAAVTERIRLATGIVNPYTRGPALLAQQAAALQDASGGRFVLGIGSSSKVIVERWDGGAFVKPLSKGREAGETLRTLFARERRPGGVKLQTPPSEPIPLVVDAAHRVRRRARAGRLQARDAAFGADPDRRRSAARQDARGGRRARRRGVYQLPAPVRVAAGQAGLRPRRQGARLPLLPRAPARG